MSNFWLPLVINNGEVYETGNTGVASSTAGSQLKIPGFKALL